MCFFLLPFLNFFLLSLSSILISYTISPHLFSQPPFISLPYPLNHSSFHSFSFQQYFVYLPFPSTRPSFTYLILTAILLFSTFSLLVFHCFFLPHILIFRTFSSYFSTQASILLFVPPSLSKQFLSPIHLYFQIIPYPDNTGVGLNIFLYTGLGMVAIGLVLTVVGVGEKGFKTVEMKLLGPALLVVGAVLSILR